MDVAAWPLAELELHEAARGAEIGEGATAWIVVTFVAWGLAVGLAYDRTRAGRFIGSRRILLATASDRSLLPQRLTAVAVTVAVSVP